MRLGNLASESVSGFDKVDEMSGCLWVSSGEQHGVVGRADRCGGNCVGENGAFLGESINVWCINLFFAIYWQ